jgi:hypothetical protein
MVVYCLLFCSYDCLIMKTLSPANQCIHLTDSQYLLYFLKLHNVSIEQYQEYCIKFQAHMSLDVETMLSNTLLEHSINLMPYLFTCIIVEPSSFNRFLVYCSRYIELPRVQHQDTHRDDYMYHVLTSDVSTMVIVLHLMQYYFL